MAVQTSYQQNMDVAFAGMIADGAEVKDVIAMQNEEAVSEMPFGVAVNFEGSTFDKGALLPDNLADVVAGILLHTHAVSKDPAGDLGLVGLKPGAVLNIMRKGRVWVICENGCSPADRLHVAIGTSGDAEGTLRSLADGANTIASTGQGVWLTTAAAGALAVLEVDFTNLPA